MDKIDGDDVEENQRNTTPLAGEPIRDTLTSMPTLAKNNEVYVKDVGQIKNTAILRGKGGAAHTSRPPYALNQANSLQGVNKSCITQVGKKHIGMSRPYNLVNHVKHIQGLNKGLRLTSKPSPILRELMCSQASLEEDLIVDLDLLDPSVKLPSREKE
ncbi:hypothetical protein Cgig2_009037 [Carnegiea gigantea]|uniref:Uncharacterized protein n=1 Tax=Carnegiea gigantea TaxID=171969 RepID=A0A9Q1KCV1_9CARY|nr:hypothetical protein Cgig2_009037 [Carnegiea gigantea]